jgi:hypothetical protein
MDEGPCIREWRRKLSLTWTNERGGREQMKLKSASELQLKKESLVLTKPGRGPKYSLDGGVRAARRFRERLRCPKWEAWRGSSSPRDGGCMAGFPSRIEGCPNLDLERGQPMICSVFWKIELSIPWWESACSAETINARLPYLPIQDESRYSICNTRRAQAHVHPNMIGCAVINRMRE